MSSKHTGSERRGGSADQIIETTIPAKKPASDLPTDDFFKQTRFKPSYATGAPNDALAGRVEGIHVFGGLHNRQKTIDRFLDAIVRYEPDIIAVEACHRAIRQHHPDRRNLPWPPDHEVQAGAFAVRNTDDLSIAGIDLPYSEKIGRGGSDDFADADAAIFQELGLIDSPDDLTIDTYYQLDRALIREWRELTKQRIPELFDEVIAIRDDVMAGHLYELYHFDTVETVVAMVGVHHLTGVLDRLQDPIQIPDTRFERPEVYAYEPGELDALSSEG